MTKYKYHRSVSYVENGNKTSYVTQLYAVGVYFIMDNNPALQMNLKPSDLVRLEKKLKKGVTEGRITDLDLGLEITVAEVDGFWKELNN